MLKLLFNTDSSSGHLTVLKPSYLVSEGLGSLLKYGGESLDQSLFTEGELDTGDTGLHLWGNKSNISHIQSQWKVFRLFRVFHILYLPKYSEPSFSTCLRHLWQQRQPLVLLQIIL